MKRKRGGRSKAAPAADSTSPESPSSPSTEAASPLNLSESEAPVTAKAVAVPEPPPPARPLPPPETWKLTATTPANPTDMVTYTKPKVGAVYGRVKLKFKSSKVAEPTLPPQSSLDAQAPTADAAKSENTAIAQGNKEVATEKVTVALTDGQQTDAHVPELSVSDKEKGARKIGGIKIKSTGLSSIENNTPDRKADSVDEPLPVSKQDAVSENREIDDTPETRSSQGSEENQSTPKRQRDEKELASALEAIKKVMKMDAAEPFNVPVDPVALGIPDYFDVIDTPMDFGTICQDLERGNKYMNSEDVYKDVQFIWDNCVKYNSKGDYIIELMKRVKKAFMKNWLAAGLFTDMPESGGNDNAGDEEAKVPAKNKSKSKRRRPGNDRHKNDCACAVCQVTRRKKERDEILAIIDNETAAVNSNTPDQNNIEGNSGADNPGSHDTSSSQEQLPQTDVYKETAEANDTGIRMEDHPSDLPRSGYEDEGSRQHYEEKEEVEYRDMNSQDETPSQPNDYSEVEHHPHKIESDQEVEMEDYPIQQENPSFFELCASLFPSNRSSILRGRHSLFRRQRQGPLKSGPLHAAMTVLIKR